MFVKQFVLEGLGNSSYLIASRDTGAAAVIDPQRDVDIYLRAAKEAGVRIEYALETHLHADFVSGSRELAAATGARIGASADGQLQFEHTPLKEGDRIELGEIVLEVMATPGHTPEHISFLARKKSDNATIGLFSGGALIVGGAARTDLLGHEHTEALTERLYDTLHHKLTHLPDELEVYPTHGAGSFCIASEQEERTTTIGRERRHNPLLRASSLQEFKKLALEGLPSYPTYFRRMRAVNQRGPQVIEGLPKLLPIPPAELRGRLEGVVVVDIRSPDSFARGHIPGAYGITLRDAFVSWLGWVAPPDKPLVFVDHDSRDMLEATRQAIRIGYDDITGYLEGGMPVWEKAGFPVEKSGLVNVKEVYEQLQTRNGLVVLDVRQDAEWREARIPGAIHIELGELEDRVNELPRDATFAVHCAAGQRSSTGVSILQRHGFKRVNNVVGGIIAWRRADLPVESDQ